MACGTSNYALNISLVFFYIIYLKCAGVLLLDSNTYNSIIGRCFFYNIQSAPLCRLNVCRLSRLFNFKAAERFRKGKQIFCFLILRYFNSGTRIGLVEVGLVAFAVGLVEAIT